MVEQLNQFKVTAYEPRTMTVVEEDVRVRQVVKISYFKITLVVNLDVELAVANSDPSLAFFKSNLEEIEKTISSK